MFNETKRKIAQKCLEEMLDKQDPFIYKDLAIAARTIANRMMMDWLDSKRINHCADCPSTDQLLSVADRYQCTTHAKDQAVKLELVCP